MTPAEKYAFIKNNVLRRSFRRWPAYNECLKAAKIEGFIENVKGQLTIRRVYYKCADCGYTYPRKDVNVDHRIPVVPAEGWDGDWNSLIEGMFCGVDNLDVLCAYKGEREEDGVVYRSCHYFKTRAERELRTEANRKKKGKI